MSKVYVLGAGAGASYKGSFLGETSPVAKNFFEKAMKVMKIHRIRGRHFGDEEQTYNNIFDFINVFWGVSKENISQSNLDMEEVLTLLSIELEEDLLGRGRLLQAYEEYLLLLALTFEKILYGEPCPHHSSIAQSLNPGDTIISFNYELLMDYALHNLHTPKLNWHFRSGYGISCRQLNGNVESEDIGKVASNIKLLKLHGSLNWLYCPSCGQLYTYEHSDNVGESVIINSMSNMVKCATENCCQRLNRVIIPPTLMKNYQSTPFIPNLWRQAREALQVAKEVIVLGYSFPTTDFRSNWMFRKAMAHNDLLEKVVIIDTAEGYQLEALLAKHRSIFRKDDIEFYHSITQCQQ